MKQHQYRITVEHLADMQGNPAENQSLTFNAPNHDDLFMLLEKVKQNRPDINGEDLTHFLIGLKLFGEVVLENRDDEFFAQFSPFVKEIMLTLKGRK